MEIFSALLVLCAGNSPVTGEYPAQRPVTRSFDIAFDLRLNKRLSKQSWGWWFETPSWSLWRHRHEKTSQEVCAQFFLCCVVLWFGSGRRFNIKMSSYQYRKSHCGDKTISWPSYLHNGISYTGKTSSVYWIRAQVYAFHHIPFMALWQLTQFTNLKLNQSSHILQCTIL